MPTIEHSILSGSEIHEPKGAATASSNQTYVADGAGSGTWAEPEPKDIDGASADEVYVADGAGSGDWQTPVLVGWENIDHNGSSQSLTASTRTKVLNDAAGAATITTYALPGNTGSIWDSTNNEFDWEAAGLEVGDTVDIRFDVEYTTDTNNDGFTFEIDLGVGSSTNITLPIDQRNIDVAGTQRVVRFISIFIGNNDILTSPAELYVTADSSNDSIEVNGWYVKMEPRTPRYS